MSSSSTMDMKPHSYTKTGTTTTTMGLIFKDGVVLGASSNGSKIHYMAPNIYCCGADTEAVSDMVSSQLHELLGDHGTTTTTTTGRDRCRVITALTLLKDHLFINYQGYYNVSAALVLGGVDCTGPHLHKIYPDGSTDTSLSFAAMGSGSLAAMAVLESGHEHGMSREEGMNLVAEAVWSADLASGRRRSNVDICVVTKGKTECLRRLNW